MRSAVAASEPVSSLKAFTFSSSIVGPTVHRVQSVLQFFTAPPRAHPSALPGWRAAHTALASLETRRYVLSSI